MSAVIAGWYISIFRPLVSSNDRKLKFLKNILTIISSPVIHSKGQNGRRTYYGGSLQEHPQMYWGADNDNNDMETGESGKQIWNCWNVLKS